MAGAAIRSTVLAYRRRFPGPAWPLALVVAAAMLLPLVYLIVRALDADAAAWSALGHASSLRLLVRTALLALAVASASLVLALPIAWLTVRTDLPLRRLWSVLAIVPLVVPSYVGAVAFIAAFGPRGTLQEILSPLGVDAVPQIYGFPGAFLALTLFSYPYLLLVLRAGLRGVDPALEDASRSLGMGSWQTFWRVTVPQLRVPITVGLLLVALYVVSDFGAVSLLRTDTLTRAIFVQYQNSFDRAAAAVLGLELVGLVALILLLEWLYRRRGRFHGSGPGTPRPPRLLRLGHWRWPALAFLGAIVLVALGVPAGVLPALARAGTTSWRAFRGHMERRAQLRLGLCGGGAGGGGGGDSRRDRRRSQAVAASGFGGARRLYRLCVTRHRGRAVPGVLRLAGRAGCVPELGAAGLRLSRTLLPTGARRGPDFVGADPPRDRRRPPAAWADRQGACWPRSRFLSSSLDS